MAERQGSGISIQPMNSATKNLNEQSTRTSDELLAIPTAVTGSGSLISKWYCIVLINFK